MTYRELLAQIQALSPEQLDTEVQYLDGNTGEFLGVYGLDRMGAFSGEDDDNPLLLLKR